MKKEYRIKQNTEIQSILEAKNIVAGKHFIIYKKENQQNSHFRYALSVPKKLGIAVKRNLMKRRIRSIVDGQQLVSEDFFIIARASAGNLSFDEIKKELLELLKKLNLMEISYE